MARISVVHYFDALPNHRTSGELSVVFAAGWALLVALHLNSDNPLFNLVIERNNASTFQVPLDWSMSLRDFLDDVESQMLNPPSDRNGTEQDISDSPMLGSLLILESWNSLNETSLSGIWQSSTVIGARKLVVVTSKSPELERPKIEAFFEAKIGSEEDIGRLLQQYKHLIHSLVDHDRTHTLDSLQLLSSTDHHEMMERNATLPSTIDECVHRLIEKRVHSHPHRLAICTSELELTYRELNELADRLAYHLASLGVCAEQSVVLCFEKSAWAAVAMLAILKAGGAIVFTDPADSLERAETIVAAAQADIVLTSAALSEWARGLAKHVIVVNATAISVLPPAESFVGAVSPSNTAWIVFTSGSTGTPKGVVLEHAAICTSAEANGKIKHMDENSRVFAFSNYTFDGAIQDHLFPWIRGGCVCIPSDRERTDDLAGIMNRLSVTWTFLTPSVATLLTPADVPRLKILALGGEALTSDNVRVWADAVTLQNAYGPAECSVACCVGEFKNASDDAANVGPPLASLAWICNPDCPQQLVPPGCIGELLVEGPLLARGYLRDTVTTTQAFLESPSWLPERGSSSPRRVYRTGDLVRQCADSSIVYLGRKDDQVKLRGQRVAIADIHDFLAQNKLVRHAYTCVPKTGRFANTLVCVLSLTDLPDNAGARPLESLSHVQRTSAESALLTIRESMIGNFAKYMIPTIWLPVQHLPLSSSGKTHGKTIRNWLQDDSEQKQTLDSYRQDASSIQAPDTAMGLEMQAAWAEVLHVSIQKIGSGSDFFALGGNSLSAMALTSTLRKKGVALSAVDIMRVSTLEFMAESATSHNSQSSTLTTAVSMQLNGLKRSSIAEKCGVSPESIEDVYPATPLQEALLALTMRDSGAYTVSRKFRIGKNVDVARLRSAWEACCQANPVLRTRLVHDQTAGTMQVVIKDDFLWSNETEDLVLDAGLGKPLWKVVVSGNSFNLSMHHSVYDGWSIPLLLQDIDVAYANGSPRPRPSFKSVVEYLASADQTQAEQFWTEYLSTSSAVSYPAIQVSDVEPQCTGSTRRMIRFTSMIDSTITTATLAIAAWSVVLGRYTGAWDVTFGLITSGRLIPVEGVEDILGPLVATSPFRVQINREEYLRVFLETMQKELAEMTPYVHYGLQNIRQLSPEMRTAASFNNTFVVHPLAEAATSSSILYAEETEEVNPNDYRTYPLHTSCTVTESGTLEVKMRFDPAVIPSEEASHLMDYFENVVHAMTGSATDKSITDVEQSIVALPAKPSIEEIDSVDRCVHNLIESNVKSQVDSPAICSWDANLSYMELNLLADRLAHHLLDGYISNAKSRICFSFEKSSLPVVAMLAIMKAGGTCVPLDISFPLDRVQSIVQRCQPAALICSRKQAAAFQDLGLTNVLILDHDVLAELPAVSGPASSLAKPTDSCYILFTSGSTGVPKGCVWEHRTLSSSTSAHGKAMLIGPTSRVFQFSAFMWDISVLETITTLVHGGCICIPSEEARLNDIVGSMNEMKVTWSWFTPSLARSLRLKEARTLETLVLGGEVIGQDNIDQYRDHFRLMTGYGPTECCIAVSMADFTARRDIKSGNIGTGVGAQLWIVDAEDAHTLLPFGAPGEILIEGPTVGRGYLQDPERTADVFLKDLAWSRTKSTKEPRRFYRSGDLGRLNADGTLTFLGRKDDQIKVNGQRLELGEIEHQLLAVQYIHHAVVISCQGRLAAVVALRDFDSMPADTSVLKLVDDPQRIVDIEATLARKLPPFGIPSDWFLVESVPLTPAGKINRQHIRRWAEKELERITLDATGGTNSQLQEVMPPETEGQRTLQGAWSTVLQIPENCIGLGSSFHQLGGKSVSMSRCIASSRRAVDMRTLQFKDSAIWVSLPFG